MKKLKQKPTHHPDLPFIKSGWTGNPVNAKNQYYNLDGPSEKSFKEVFRWQKQKNPLKHLKKKQQSPVKVIFREKMIQNNNHHLTWLGHTTFLIQLQKKNFLTDPVLYGVGPVKRYTALPCPVQALQPLDFILLSHNHRDHCDKKSMQQICSLNKDAKIITGLEIGALLRSWKIKNEIIEMGWYQQLDLDKDLTCTYLPAKHWNRRGLYDLNEMLWGSFMIQSKKVTLYFGADSGMGKHFREIGTLFSQIDYALLGIGAYMPEWFMGPSHTSPKDAVKAFEQLNANTLIPMHHGTFDLSDEPIGYPLEQMKNWIQEKKLTNIKNLAIGELLILDKE